MLPCSTITLLIPDYKGSKFFISNYVILKFPFRRRLFENFTWSSPDQVLVLGPFPATTLGSIPSQRGLKLHVHTPARGRVSRGRLQMGPGATLVRSVVISSSAFLQTANEGLPAWRGWALNIHHTGLRRREWRPIRTQIHKKSPAIDHPGEIGAWRALKT